MFWLSIIKTEKWDDVFQERAGLDQPPKRQAGCTEVNVCGETFRQKDWRTYRILNLVLKAL